MIHKDGNELSARFWGSKIVVSVYRGIKALWFNLKSCFGGGDWNNDQPWDNDDGWSNG